MILDPNSLTAPRRGLASSAAAPDHLLSPFLRRSDASNVGEEHRGPRWLAILAVAAIYLALNLAKPLHEDDYAYYSFARHIARDPAHPYGFVSDVAHGQVPAMRILAPAGFLYWFSAGIRLFGENVLLWKLWLGPIVCTGVLAHYLVARRFAPQLAVFAVALTWLSPAFLPALNFMLDIPALAVELLAVALFFRAIDRRSIGRALLAGLVAGVAMQTKYNAVTVVGWLFVAGLLSGAPGLALVFVTGALGVFVGWEWFLYQQHGASHFLTSLQAQNPKPLSKALHLTLPLLTNLAGAGIGIMLLGLWVQWKSRRRLMVATIGYFFGLALVVIVPRSMSVYVRDVRTGAERLNLTTLVFATMALFGSLVVLSAMAKLIWRTWAGNGKPGADSTIESPPLLAGVGRVLARVCAFLASNTGLLLCWLAIEVAGYLVLSPFPATRRVMGVFLVLVLLLCQLAPEPMWRNRRAWAGILVVNFLAGFFIHFVDFWDAATLRQAALVATKRAKDIAQPGQTWYLGTLGMQYYADQAGARPVIMSESTVHSGDVLVVLRAIAANQEFFFDPPKAELIDAAVFDDWLPWQTQATYYANRVPIAPRRGPRAEAYIYRITGDTRLRPMRVR